jgi:hypothetical protein
MENPSNWGGKDDGKRAEFVGWKLPPSLFHRRSKFKDSAAEEQKDPGHNNSPVSISVPAGIR